MLKLTILTSSILTATLALTACGGGDSSTPAQSTPSPTTPTLPVDNSPDVIEKNIISGVITDISRQPLAGVAVTIGQDTVITDQSGTYTFNLSQALGNHIEPTTLIVKKAGYFTTIQELSLVAEKAYTFDISLIADHLSTVFETSNKSIQHISSQAFVTINPNSLANSSGQIYTDAANLAASYYSPDLADGNSTFTPHFLGQRKDGQTLTNLANVGLIEVKLTDALGSPLSLSENQTISLSFPETSTDQNLDSIPLWYYDEEQKFWIEEGVAKRQTNNNGKNSYIANASRTGLWSINIPLDQQSAIVEGCITDSVSGQSLSQPDLIIGGRGFETYSQTDNRGNFSIIVPVNTPLLLSPIKHPVNFSEIQIPALANNETYSINNGSCIIASPNDNEALVDLNTQKNTFYGQLALLPEITKPMIMSSTFKPPLTPTNRENIIGYQFELVDDSKITDILFKEVSEYVDTQYSKYNTISYTLQSLYADNDKYVDDYRYWKKNIMSSIGLFDSSAIGGKYKGPYIESQNDNRSEIAAIIQYHSTFDNNQLTRNYADMLLLTNTYRDPSFSNQKLGDILLYSLPKTPENVSIVNALNNLPESISTFDDAASCKVLTARTTNADYIEYEYHFGADKGQYADIPIPLVNPITDSWFFITSSIAWSAEQTINDDGISRAVRHYDNGTYDEGIYARQNSLTVSPTEKQQCNLYNEAAKNQLLEALSKITLPS